MTIPEMVDLLGNIDARIVDLQVERETLWLNLSEIAELLGVETIPGGRHTFCLDRDGMFRSRLAAKLAAVFEKEPFPSAEERMRAVQDVVFDNGQVCKAPHPSTIQ